MKPLPQKFFRRSTKQVAQDLLGCVLHCRQADGSIISARIVETEAYLSTRDPASHSFKGPTRRNASMFLRGGHFYVYFIYGMYFCVNVVTREAACAEAVLIRALQPLDGSYDKSLMGPGKLCRQLSITKKHDGLACNSKELWITAPAKRERLKRHKAARIGLNKRLGDCTTWELRYYLPGLSTR